MAARRFGDPVHLAWAAHGLDFLERRHRQPAGGYAWVLDGSGVRDATNHGYGLAFVMVAGATALLAGLPQGRATLERAWDLLESHFWDAPRSEARRVGKECVSTCRSRWSPDHSTKNHNIN